MTSGTNGFHDVTGGVYKAWERIHGAVADAPLLAIPASCRRGADDNLNWARFRLSSATDRKSTRLNSSHGYSSQPHLHHPPPPPPHLPRTRVVGPHLQPIPASCRRVADDNLNWARFRLSSA